MRCGLGAKLRFSHSAQVDVLQQSLEDKALGVGSFGPRPDGPAAHRVLIGAGLRGFAPIWALGLKIGSYNPLKTQHLRAALYAGRND